MNYVAKLAQYKKTNVTTATGIELVVLCYEQAIKSLSEAKVHYEQKEYIQKGKALQNALDIIGELKVALDFERGGEIAKNLDAIYAYIMKTLLEADIKRQLDSFDHSIQILTELKEAWEGIASTQPQAAPVKIQKQVEHLMAAG